MQSFTGPLNPVPPATPVLQPSSSPVFSNILERRILLEHKKMILQSFDEAKEAAGKSLATFTLEQHVKEYLNKLLLQISLANRILLQTQEINNQQCIQILTLWKCAKRRDVTAYFKKLEAKQQLSTHSSITGIIPFDINPIVPLTVDWFDAILNLPNLIDIKYAGKKIKNFGNAQLFGIELALLSKLILDKPGTASFFVEEYQEFKTPKKYPSDSKTTLSQMLSDSKTSLFDNCIFEIKPGVVKSPWFKAILGALIAAHFEVRNVRFLYNAYETYFFQILLDRLLCNFDLVWSKANLEEAKQICVNGHSFESVFYTDPSSAYASGECKNLMISGNIPNKKLPILLFTVVKTAPSSRSSEPMQGVTATPLNPR